MSKLEKIKAELAKLLIKYSVVKTDKAVLEYDGEDLVAGMDIFITNENGEKVPAEDGEYVTEDNKKITVKDGKVESIVDPVAEVDAEEDEKKEDEPMLEPVAEEPMPEDKKEDEEKKDEEVNLEDVNTAIDELRKEVDELYKIVDSLLKKVGETREEADERLKKLECKSLAKPASEEFEAISRLQKTGNKKLDKFLSAIKK